MAVFYDIDVTYIWVAWPVLWEREIVNLVSNVKPLTPHHHKSQHSESSGVMTDFSSIGGHFIRYQSGVGVWPEFSIKCDWPVWHPDLNLALGNLSLNQITGQLSGNNFNICTFLPMKLLGTLEFSVRMKLVRLSKTKNNNNIPRLLPISVRIFSRLPQNLTQTPYQD